MSGYHDVRSGGQSLARVPKPLSDTTFDSIAGYRVTHSLADRNPQSSPLLSRSSDGSRDSRCNYDRKPPRSPAISRLHGTRKISRAQDSVRSLKAARCRRHELLRRSTGCEALAALGATSLEDCAPGARLEARAKSMNPLSRDAARLIGAFHRRPSIFGLSRIRSGRGRSSVCCSTSMSRVVHPEHR